MVRCHAMQGVTQAAVTDLERSSLHPVGSTAAGDMAPRGNVGDGQLSRKHPRSFRSRPGPTRPTLPWPCFCHAVFLLLPAASTAGSAASVAIAPVAAAVRRIACGNGKVSRLAGHHASICSDVEGFLSGMVRCHARQGVGKHLQRRRRNSVGDGKVSR